MSKRSALLLLGVWVTLFLAGCATALNALLRCGHPDETDNLRWHRD